MTEVEATGVAQERSWRDAAMPEVEQVRPGLWSIPVPIPNNPLRYVLVYAFELDDGVAIVDAGWDTDEAWSALELGLQQPGERNDVLDVAVADRNPLVQNDLEQPARRHQLGLQVGDDVIGQRHVVMVGQLEHAHLPVGAPSAGSIDRAISMAMPVPPVDMTLEVSAWGRSDA